MIVRCVRAACTLCGEDVAHHINELGLCHVSSSEHQILSISSLYKLLRSNRLEPMDVEQFMGLSAQLRLCVGARVVLTKNEWVEAGLVNGALGCVRGFAFPEGSDPRSEDSAKVAPLCVFVEFDDVQFGTDGTGSEFSFFPEDPVRRKWVPVFRSLVVSVDSDSQITREQFPLTLALALTLWKAQGMTLRRIKSC